LFGYATAWLEYQLRGNPIAADAFTGPHPELVSNTRQRHQVTGSDRQSARAGKDRESAERRSRQKSTQNTRIREAADRASRQHDPAHSGG
jgi:hypothetical protein